MIENEFYGLTTPTLKFEGGVVGRFNANKNNSELSAKMSIFDFVLNSSYFFLVVSILLFHSVSQGRNLHLLEEVDSGFSIYRTGKPSAEDMKEFCRLGISEIAVLSGDARAVEHKLKKHCPTLRVVYNQAQSPRVPLTSDFLDNFDKWVSSAKRLGKKIAFRCHCGCHRTGRLAAYYRMKYQDFSLRQALIEMYQVGDYMWFYPELGEQVLGLYDHINGQSCTAIPFYCVRK